MGLSQSYGPSQHNTGQNEGHIADTPVGKCDLKTGREITMNLFNESYWVGHEKKREEIHTLPHSQNDLLDPLYGLGARKE